MGIIRAALCDDDPRWLAQAQRILHDFANARGLHVELVTHADGQSLLQASETPPDVLFCDIELADDKSGIDLVRSVSQAWPYCQIVYVTNFLRYAPDVYTTEHLWFVTKERFEEQLPEVMDKLARKMDDGTRYLELHANAREVVRIPCLEVACMERRGRETLVTMVDGSTISVRERIAELMEQVPRHMFAQCHGSFVVNLGQVRMLHTGEITLIDGSVVPVSRRYLRHVRNAYLEWVDDHAV